MLNSCCCFLVCSVAFSIWLFVYHRARIYQADINEMIYFSYSLLGPFMCFTTNQFAQKLEFFANLVAYFVNICNIY